MFMFTLEGHRDRQVRTGNILIVLQRHPAWLVVLCNMLTDLMGGINLQFEQLVITRYDLMSQFLLQICLQCSKTETEAEI